jgi:hypothetical protein
MCYVVPTASAIVTTLLWKKSKNVKVGWLNLMFIGGALFGAIDHLWNGELFLIGKNIASDLLLGVVIASFIFATWSVIVLLSRVNPASRMNLFRQR